RCAATSRPRAKSRPARSPISRRTRRTIRRSTPRSISSAASRRTRLIRRIQSPRCRTSTARTDTEPGAACGPPQCFLARQYARLGRQQRLSLLTLASRARHAGTTEEEHAPLQIPPLSSLRRHGRIQLQGARLPPPPHRQSPPYPHHTRVPPPP